MKKINITKETQIEAAIELAQKRAQTRTIDCTDIKDYVEKIEKRLASLKVAKKEWKGAKFHVNKYAHIFPSAYKGTPEGTVFTIERGSNDWFITGIGRGNCNTGACHELEFSNESEYKNHYKF